MISIDIPLMLNNSTKIELHFVECCDSAHMALVEHKTLESQLISSLIIKVNIEEKGDAIY